MGPNNLSSRVDESSPLLRNNLNRTREADFQGGRPSSRAYRFFLDCSSTPGQDSPNYLVKNLSNFWHITKLTLLSNYVNILLVLVPVGIVAGKLQWTATLVFVFNFFAIIPLASVLSFATEQIAMKLGDAIGGLLNATFGNAVELIVSIVALREGHIDIVQSSMLGSILSNLLLVLGMCFFFGGLKNMTNSSTGQGLEQKFASAVAQTTCSLMALSSATLILPSTLYSVLGPNDPADKERSILLLSRVSAVVLLALYVLYLWFQIRTHPNLFESENEQCDGNEPEEPVVGVIPALLILVVTTVLVSICADYLVGSIDETVEQAHIGKTFVGLILIPIVGNAAEHVTAVVMAVRNKMDLAMAVAIGSSIQIALFVTPFLVLLGWVVMDQPMTLHFESLEVVTFAASALIVAYIVRDGYSNYLEGALLLGLYLIIAVAFFVSPDFA